MLRISTIQNIGLSTDIATVIYENGFSESIPYSDSFKRWYYTFHNDNEAIERIEGLSCIISDTLMCLTGEAFQSAYKVSGDRRYFTEIDRSDTDRISEIFEEIFCDDHIKNDTNEVMSNLIASINPKIRLSQNRIGIKSDPFLNTHLNLIPNYLELVVREDPDNDTEVAIGIATDDGRIVRYR